MKEPCDCIEGMTKTCGRRDCTSRPDRPPPTPIPSCGRAPEQERAISFLSQALRTLVGLAVITLVLAAFAGAGYLYQIIFVFLGAPPMPLAGFDDWACLMVLGLVGTMLTAGACALSHTIGNDVCKRWRKDCK